MKNITLINLSCAVFIWNGAFLRRIVECAQQIGGLRLLWCKKEKTLMKISVLNAVRTGLEPATSCVTGRHSNQLN